MESKDPVARKLYLWMYLNGNKGELDYDSLTRFIRENEAWPDTEIFLKKAEEAMPANTGTDEILAWFAAHPPLTARGLDRYLDALLIRNEKTKAKDILEEWWISKLATREEQKLIYYKYGRLIDMEAHRRRLDTLLFSGQYTNARGIAGALGPGFPQLTEARIALAEGKPNAGALIHKIPSHLRNDPGLAFERLRWRRKKGLDAEAMEILRRHPPVKKIQNPEDWWKEQHILIRRLLEAGRYESAFRLADMHFQKDGPAFADAEWLAGWLALRYGGNAQKAYQRFEAMYGQVETPISKSRAAYWAGQAADKMGDAELAKSWREKAAKFQTAFYGQLAGAKLGMAQALPNAAPPKIEDAQIKAFQGSGLIRAAVILNAAGMTKEAGRFLENFAEHENTPKAYRFSAELAGEMGARRIALKIAKEATKQGMFLTAQSFPVITENLKNEDIEWALAHAVIRQESMFDADAESPAGALGLMQLMPATARHVAKKEGVGYSRDSLTSSPAYNIRLGCAYMEELLDRYDGYYPLAIAAYNAGPGNVDKWLGAFGDPRRKEISLIDWIELIPIYETRNYVQRVLESVYIYRLRLKGIQKTVDSLIHIAMRGE